jgi:CheY-like chemotaxis protein
MDVQQLHSILLVDDDEVTNFYVEHLIRKMKLADNVHVEMTGRDAMDYLYQVMKDGGENLPQLILLDINMPVMNGFEFLEEFEQSVVASKYNGKIYMLTSSALDLDKQRAARFSFLNGFYTKPLNTSMLGEIAQQFGHPAA